MREVARWNDSESCRLLQGNIGKTGEWTQEGKQKPQGSMGDADRALQRRLYDGT